MVRGKERVTLMQSQSAEQVLQVSIDDQIHLYPTYKEEQVPRIQSRILGCRSGDFLIIENVDGLRSLSDPFDTKLVCVSFHKGITYYFRSRVLKYFPEEPFVILEYPGLVLNKKIRAYPRIPTKLETLFRVQDNNAPINKSLEEFRGQIFTGTTVDISRGGCRVLLQVPKKIPVETLCSIDFVLPDRQQIEELEAVVVKSEFLDSQTADIRLRFLGPTGQMRKISLFCELVEALPGLEE